MELDGIKVRWLGHATFLITTPEGKRILVDPWLGGNPKCPEEFEKVSSDAILVTHGHADHIGNIFDVHDKCGGPIVGIYELTSWLGTKGVPEDKLVGMNKGGTVRNDDLEITITMVDAKHSSSFQEEDGSIVYLGEAAGYVIGFSNGISLYLAGDTCLFGDMELIGDIYEPDIAILPIGDWFTMDPNAAAMAADYLGVEGVIPCHYGTFPVLTGTPEMLRAALDEMGLDDVEVVALEPGQEID